MITSPISAGEMDARSMAPRIATAPRSTADTSLNAPPNAPIGVRHALRMTGASALRRTLSMASALQLFAPAPACDEDILEPVAGRQILSQVAQQLDQRIERGADRIGVGGGDILPDVGGTRRQARGVDEAS